MSAAHAGPGKGPHSGHHRPTFARYLVKQAPFIGLAIAIAFGLHHVGAFKTFEGAALDTLLKTAAPHPVADIVIVTIDDQDFEEIFDSRSPIAVDGLQRVLDAAARGRPALIGVDLDTSDPSFAALTLPLMPTVWARDAVPAEPQLIEEASGERAHTEAVAPTVCMEPVLGGDGSALKGNAFFGVALAPLDADGVVRKYFRTFGSGTPRTCPEGGAASGTPSTCSSVPSFVGALHHSSSGGTPKGDADHSPCEPIEEPLILNFAGDRFVVGRIPARDVLALADTPGFAESGPLTGRTVLIGGTWRAARDEYLTPVGQMFGVELAAQALAAEGAGGGIRSTDEFIALALEGLMALALVWVAWRFSFGRALAISIIGLPLLALVGSLLAFRAFAFWFDFFAPMLGVFLHLLVDHAREYALLRKELAGVHAELAAALGRERARAAEVVSGAGAEAPPEASPATLPAAPVAVSAPSVTPGMTGSEPNQHPAVSPTVE